MHLIRLMFVFVSPLCSHVDDARMSPTPPKHYHHTNQSPLCHHAKMHAGRHLLPRHTERLPPSSPFTFARHCSGEGVTAPSYSYSVHPSSTARCHRLRGVSSIRASNPLLLIAPLAAAASLAVPSAPTRSQQCCCYHRASQPSGTCCHRGNSSGSWGGAGCCIVRARAAVLQEVLSWIDAENATVPHYGRSVEWHGRPPPARAAKKVWGVADGFYALQVHFNDLRRPTRAPSSTRTARDPKKQKRKKKDQDGCGLCRGCRSMPWKPPLQDQPAEKGCCLSRERARAQESGTGCLSLPWTPLHHTTGTTASVNVGTIVCAFGEMADRVQAAAVAIGVNPPCRYCQ
jgi:hypothetical protein